jgi:hypothetical protein
MLKTTWMRRGTLSCALCVTLGVFGTTASAQDWHITDYNGSPATLPDQDNDGVGNRQGTGECDFEMNRGSGFAAHLLAYSSRGMAPYSQANLTSQAWERLSVEIGNDAIWNDYSPNVMIWNWCTTADGSPDNQEGFESGWYQLGYQQPTPNFGCPANKPVLIQSWCRTAAWW